MAPPVCEVLLTEAALEFLPPPKRTETGAVLDFWGVVRGLEDGDEITGIEYEAYRAMAEHQLREVAQEGMKLFALREIKICHRLGFVPVGEASLLVRVATGHRAEAFRANEWVVNELKKRAPIWKHPAFARATARPARFASV